jgi:hypothetical protein
MVPDRPRKAATDAHVDPGTIVALDRTHEFNTEEDEVCGFGDVRQEGDQDRPSGVEEPEHGIATTVGPNQTVREEHPCSGSPRCVGDWPRHREAPALRLAESPLPLRGSS